MPRVFTVFNHGTGHHRDTDPNEVVTLLHDAVEGEEARIGPDRELVHERPTFLICEGPGSDTMDAADSKRTRHRVSHAHPGQDNPIHNQPKREVTGEALPDSEFHRDFLGETPWNDQTAGRESGAGWDDNVYRTVWLLTHLKFERGLDIQTVNLVGWGRGAVTCIKQANKLYEVFDRHLEVNLFAIDPVPEGSTLRTPGMFLLPPNVRDCLVVLAADEDRPSLHAPNIHVLSLPGHHEDLVRVEAGRDAVDSARQCLHLAHEFLSHHGTVFSQVPEMGARKPRSV